MTNNGKEYQHQQIKLLERIVWASHAELLTAMVGLLNRCQKADLIEEDTKNHGTLYTTEIYSILNSVLNPQEGA